MNNKIKIILIIVVAIMLDQATKAFALSQDVNMTLVPGLLNFTLVKNSGAAFGLVQGANYFLAALSLLICVLLLVYISYLKKTNQTISPAVYLILAGGLGNVIDRVFRGFVVDFIDTPFIDTFNLADSFIVIGAIWVGVSEIISSLKELKVKTA